MTQKRNSIFETNELQESGPCVELNHKEVYHGATLLFYWEAYIIKIGIMPLCHRLLDLVTAGGAMTGADYRTKNSPDCL